MYNFLKEKMFSEVLFMHELKTAQAKRSIKKQDPFFEMRIDSNQEILIFILAQPFLQWISDNYSCQR